MRLEKWPHENQGSVSVYPPVFASPFFILLRFLSLHTRSISLGMLFHRSQFKLYMPNKSKSEKCRSTIIDTDMNRAKNANVHFTSVHICPPLLTAIHIHEKSCNFLHWKQFVRPQGRTKVKKVGPGRDCFTWFFQLVASLWLVHEMPVERFWLVLA